MSLGSFVAISVSFWLIDLENSNNIAPVWNKLIDQWQKYKDAVLPL